uniref:Uncharacterized protein n=1 Tax=Romanomermis culicivorax TaxID=13658 RepID=A0A915K788_ROMCU
MALSKTKTRFTFGFINTVSQRTPESQQPAKANDVALGEKKYLTLSGHFRLQLWKNLMNLPLTSTNGIITQLCNVFHLLNAIK